jgi:hypothetical protein
MTVPPNPNIQLNGRVQASWSADKNSYVVAFMGAVTRPNVITVCSSDLAGVPDVNRPIIVVTHIA